MRSFSIKGMATKAFYGPNAQSLGAPTGYGSGNSSGGGGGVTPVIVPQFARTDGGVLDPADVIASLTIGGNTVIGPANFTDTFIVRSSNTGLTWSRFDIGSPGGVITSLAIVAADGAGNWVGVGADAGSVQHVLTSNDDGLTWADTTPGGAEPSAAPLYSKRFGLFYWWDINANQVFTSADGVTWDANPTTDTALDPFLGVEGAGCTVAAGLFGVGGPPTGGCQIWRTTNGTDWVLVFTPGVDSVIGSEGFLASNGAGLMVCMFFDGVGNIDRLYGSSNDGLTWTQVSNNGGDGDTPPFVASFAYYQGKLVTASDADTGFELAESANNGVTWPAISTVDLGQAPNFFFGSDIRASSDGNTLYFYNDAIVSTTAYPNFGTALAGDASFNTNVRTFKVAPAFVIGGGTDAAGNPAIWRL